ncbi:MAG: hypothetical protein A2W93_03830 [Bacteroidetes bacterium GWF2_43_63]|nr:MAG: hypothetical protein A2W94_15870 [Bacteroidetes bacterium GWE2_42_42]OFY55355.1 MAG: hypothetical protein A2W93_03830 [Bacteroidetes bacterium GWF2_43_63]HBG71885.1 hypothetical protein [Bacteroidales bacterium]HCB61773.1 hypothetical protein [Bacteroidales bacterium]HCY22631.1 hypothetical protein [Bacteroidales bacterium]
MKKFIYISGVVLVNLFVIGTICKLLHFPGANIFILTGLVLFVAALLPLALINNYRNNGKEKGTLYIAAYLTSALILVAAMFKIFHWPGASYLMIVATPLPFALFLPVFLYHNRKNEPRQSLNFIGVMLLLVYVAVFSSLIALNVSKTVIDGITITAHDFSTSTEVFEAKNTATYQSISKTSRTETPVAINDLKKKTEDVCQKIEAVQKELIQNIDGEESPAFSSENKININKVQNFTESNTTTAIMRGYDNHAGKATELKTMLEEYRSFLMEVAVDADLQQLIGSLLLTNDKPSAVNPGETDTWEDQYFPRNAYLITILGNLSALENNVRIAESCVLKQY